MLPPDHRNGDAGELPGKETAAADTMAVGTDTKIMASGDAVRLATVATACVGFTIGATVSGFRDLLGSTTNLQPKLKIPRGAALRSRHLSI